MTQAQIMLDSATEGVENITEQNILAYQPTAQITAQKDYGLYFLFLMAFYAGAVMGISCILTKAENTFLNGVILSAISGGVIFLILVFPKFWNYFLDKILFPNQNQNSKSPALPGSVFSNFVTGVIYAGVILSGHIAALFANFMVNLTIKNLTP